MQKGAGILFGSTGPWAAGLRVLFATTLLAGAGFGQTVNGTLAEATDFYVNPGNDFASGPGVLFRLRMVDGNGLALSFPQELPFFHGFSLFRTEADLTLPIPVGAVVDVLDTELAPLAGETVLVFHAAVQAGEDLTLILICKAFCEPELAFAFDLIGAVRVTFGPDLAEELDSLVTATSGMDRLVVLDAQRVVRDMGAVSLAARGVVAPGARDGGAGLVASTKSAAPALVGGVYSWAQVTGFDSSATGGQAGMNGGGFQIGADIAVGPDIVAGVSLGHATLAATGTATRQDGALTYLQPYLAWRPGAFHGHASLIYGRGDYDQTSISGAGTGETSLLALTVEGGLDRPLGQDLTLTPTLSLIAGRERVTGTSGTLAGAGTERVAFAQASLGAQISHQGRTGAVFAGLHADYLHQDSGAVLADGFLSDSGWTGRVEVGGSVDLGPGLGLATSVDLGGLGGSAQTLSGGLQLSLRF